MSEQVLISLSEANIFQKDNLILSDVSFQIENGEFIYLVGRTGSGKSSLLKTLYGELPLEQGEGQVVGYDLKKLKRRKVPFLRRKIGIVFQDFQLLSDRTVVDNLEFVLRATGWSSKQKIDIQVRTVLDRVGMTTKGYKFPHELSGGEQQRVAVARALLNDPDMILADEPTGNLDPITTKEIMELLHEICENGKAILMATHDYSHMKEKATRVLQCEGGRIKELDPQSETLSFEIH